MLKETTKAQVMARLGLHYEVDQHNNAAAMQSAYSKRPNVTATLPPRQPTPGSELARAELAAFASRHAQEHGK